MRETGKMDLRKPVMVLAFGAVFSLMPFLSTYAASKKPITSISLSIDAEIMPGTDIGEEDIEIDSKNEKYSIDGYTVSNSGSTWEADMVPEIQVTLTAGENFYFKSIPKSKIGLRGDGEITKGSIKDSSTTMVLTVQLPMSVPDIEEVQLSNEGIATWKAVAKAGKYELLFYKNGTAAVTPIVVNTNSYNCRERFGKTNANTSYSVKVRAVNAQDEAKRADGRSPILFLLPKRKQRISDSIRTVEPEAGRRRRTEDTVMNARTELIRLGPGKNCPAFGISSMKKDT